MIIFGIFTCNAFAQPICPLDGTTLKPKEVASFETFQGIAVLENGRVKPLDTYARNLLLQFSGKRTFEQNSEQKLEIPNA